eukprot:gene7577-11901_t
MSVQMKNSVSISDLPDYKWTKIENLSNELHHTHAAFHFESKFYFFCATNQIKYFNNLTLVFIYDEITKKSKRIFVNTPNTCSHHIGTRHKNFIYLFGHTTLKFDTEKLKFIQMNEKDLPEPSQYRCLANVGNKCYIFGGQLSSNFFIRDETLFNHLYEFDFDKEVWNLIKPVGDIIPKERRYSSMVSKNENLYIFGGRDHDTRFNDLWKYNTITNRWNEIHPNGNLIPCKRAAHSMIMKEFSIFIFGGNGGDMNNELFEFDILKNEWKLIDVTGSIPSRYWHVSFLDEMKNEMFVNAGWTNDDDSYFSDLLCIKLPPKRTNIQELIFQKAIIEGLYFEDILIK